jgi:AcrR family transcriptional regulator
MYHRPMPIRAASARRPRRSQSDRRAQSDRLLLQAAAELIARRGYGATTLEQIGQRAGYSRGLVTQKFGSKEGLVRALVTVLHQELDDVLDGQLAGGISGLEAILRIVDVYVRIFSEAQLKAAPERVVSVQAYYVLMSESVGVIPEVREFFVEANIRFRARLETHLTLAQESGAMRANLSPATAAAMIQSALSGLTLLWLVDRNTVDLDEGRTALVETIRRTLIP